MISAGDRLTMVFCHMHEWDDVELCSGVSCNCSNVFLSFGWWFIGGPASTSLSTDEVLFAGQYP